METKTLIIPNKINDARVDLDLRVSDSLLVDVCVTDTGAVCPRPAQPRVHDLGSSVPAPINQNRIEGVADLGAVRGVKGHQVGAGTTHRMSARGKAATKFSTRLGRRTCSPPV